MENLTEKWKKLTFRHFRQDIYARKHKDWEKAARLLLEFLKQGISCGLVAGTAAGKTIIALLAIFALGKRTLFLAPQRLLDEQHHALTGKMDGDSFRSRTIHGHTRRKDRIWNDPSDQIIFATPQVVLAAIRKKLFDFKDFQLIVFDEMQRATGDYAYVELGKLAHDNNLLAFGLTASPGCTLGKIRALKNALFLEKIFEVEIETPVKIESVERVKLDDNLQKIEKIFREILLELAGQISEMGIEMDQEEPTHMRIFETIEKELRAKDKYRGAYLAAKYRKLYHAYFIALTEGYGTVLKYLGRMKREDGSRAAREIVLDRRVWQLATIAKNNPHPKVEKFFESLTNLRRVGKNALVFFSQKATARTMMELLADRGWRIELLFGGSEKKIKQQMEVLQKIEEREVDFVFATSVAEEGLSIPEIDAVIHYSMPPTEISLLQRSGRTGRMNTGCVIFIVLEHPLDHAFYFAAKAKVKKMKQIIKDGMLEQETAPAPIRRSRKQHDYLTLSLFKEV